MKEKITVGLQFIMAGFAAHYTGISATLRFLFWAMGIDIVTGLAAARYQRIPIRSRELTDGAINKACVLLLCFMAHPFETFLSDSLGITVEVNLERWIPLFFIFSEILSIVKNMVKCGVDPPAFVVYLLIKGKAAVPPAATPEQLKELFGNIKIETTHTEKSTAPDGTVSAVKDKVVVTKEPAPIAAAVPVSPEEPTK